jgi:hypothetical protein
MEFARYKYSFYEYLVSVHKVGYFADRLYLYGFMREAQQTPRAAGSPDWRV